ncbi:MAG: hypothetical protein KME49_06900 [Brasilonema octagenarum HA4186-MV1]|jgi:hypothetical protein|nr:hypothetical protein [Brasilonema octagenarum HA4186-MV1]
MSISINRSKAVRKYFTSTPSKPKQPDYSSARKTMMIGGVLFVIALLILICGGAIILLSIFLGIIAFIIWGNGSFEYSQKKQRYEEDLEQYKNDYAQAEPKPSDEQIDEWMDDDIANIIEESLIKLDLEDGDYNANPLYIGGPANLDKTRYALGEDGKIRYSHLNVLIVYLTDHNILTYECVHTLIHGHTLSDITQEFPYKEITNLQIKTVNKKISFVNGNKDFVDGIHQFALYTSGANVIKVTYSFSHNIDQQGELVTIGSEETIKAVRKKLEEYKKRYQKYER